MDTLKKIFGEMKNETNDKQEKGMKTDIFDEFRKPIWYDDESDDELFDNNKSFEHFQIFTNPLEMQKHFEQQMQEVMKSLDQFEGGNGLLDKDFREGYLKPGFEANSIEEFRAPQSKFDSDLDGEIYAEQLHSLLQRLSPDLENLLKNKSIPQCNINQKTQIDAKPLQAKSKLTDEEKIWNEIHGNTDNGKMAKAQMPFFNVKPFMQIPHRGGVFEGAQQGPKMFSQSVMIQTVRKPDGSYETRRTVRDTDGQVQTTITRSKNGKTEIITENDGLQVNTIDKTDRITIDPMIKSIADGNRNLTFSKGGYLLPNNLW